MLLRHCCPIGHSALAVQGPPLGPPAEPPALSPPVPPDPPLAASPPDPAVGIPVFPAWGPGPGVVFGSEELQATIDEPPSRAERTAVRTATFLS